VLVSAFALTPIESAAFAYQLADFKTIDRRAGRFLDLKFFSFCLSSFDVMRPTFTLVRKKHLLLQLNNRRLIDRRRIGNKNNRPWKRQKVNIFNLATGSDRTPISALNLKIFSRCFSLVRDFFVFDNLPLIETAEAGSLDGGDMDKHIFAAAALRLNKPVPFLRIEPLYRAARHSQSPLMTPNDKLDNPR
jgi:hypothetical protein